MALLGGLLDGIGLKDSLGTGGLLGKLHDAYGGQDRLQGLLLAIGGNPQVGAMLMQQAAQREAAEKFGSQLPGIMGAPQAAAAPAINAPTPDYGNAIAGIESGGKYDALGPVTKTGDRAFGKYQVMGANIPQWTQAHLGKQLTPEQFLADQAAQDAVFKGQFGQYVQKYGPEGAAKAWFAGEGGMNNPNARDQLGTTVQSYAEKFNKGLGQPVQVAQAGGAPPVPAQQQAPQQGGMSPRLQQLMRMSQIPNLPPQQAKVLEMLIQQELQLARPKVPDGFELNPAGGLKPIKGGPADPEYKRTVGDRMNAPAGYRWNDPADPSKGLAAIPGGPGEKVDAEVAARLGLAKSFLNELPQIIERVKAGEATGAIDATKGYFGVGGPGEIRRKIDSGAEALLRMLTGAGMNKEEANEYTRRYRFSITDTSETLISKLEQLARELNSVGETVGRGRGGWENMQKPATSDGWQDMGGGVRIRPK